MAINRMKNRERRARKAIVEEAVRKSRAPATATPGATPSTGVIDSLIPTTTPDADGNTQKAMMWDIDSWNNNFWS